MGSNLTDLFGNVGVPELINFSYDYFVDYFNPFAENFTPVLHQIYITDFGPKRKGSANIAKPLYFIGSGGWI